MPDVVLRGLPTDIVRELQRGGSDANGHVPEVHVSDGKGNPCRHCLQMIEEGNEYLILSHKPFETTQPYSEQGPIFLHRQECEAYVDIGEQPDALSNKEMVIVRGYGLDERIVYGTGKIVPTGEIRNEANRLLEMNDVKFIHIRSSVNNCYQARIDKV